MQVRNGQPKVQGPAEDGAPPPTRALKAIEMCDKAIKDDKLSMKAHFRRGQAYKVMGDLVKARDDFLVAARQDPQSREVRKELEHVRSLEKEEEENARQLWKKDFIKEQMSFRAQQGVTSVQEAIARDINRERAAKGLAPLEDSQVISTDLP